MVPGTTSVNPFSITNMPDEVSVEDSVPQPEVAGDEQQPIAAKEAEEVKEQPAFEEEPTDIATDAEVAAESTTTETAPDGGSSDSGSDGSGSHETEGEPSLSSSILLNVDTTVHDEAEPDISAPEPVTQPLQPDEPAAALPYRASLYGSQHNWCPLCSRQTQQTADSAESKDSTGTSISDPLSLSWVEQSLFACNAEHHSNITAYKSLLPPASSLPPFIPTTLSIVGPPLSGRTSLAKRLCSSLNLTYLSISDVIDSLVDSYDQLPTLLAASLPSPPPLSLVLDCVEKVLCRLTEQHEATKGWVLDGYPTTREEAEAMQLRGLLPRQCINLSVVKKGGPHAEVAEVERRWTAREEREQRQRDEQERLRAEEAAAAAVEEERKKKEAEAAAAEEEGDERQEAGGEEAEHVEQAMQPDEQADLDAEAEGAEPADDESAADEADTEQAEDNGDATDEAVSNVDTETTSLPAAQPVTDEAVDTLRLLLSVNADGEVQVSVQWPSPPPPRVESVDLLTPYIASLRATLKTEQWAEQVATFYELLEYLQTERLLSTITVPTSLWSAQRQASESIAASAAARMAHLQALSAALPSSLSSLPFSSARLSTDLSGFGLYSAVAWHQQAALQRLHSDDASTRWVQYEGLLYPLCSQQEEQQFIADPARYHDSSSFPTDLPRPYADDAATGQLVYPLRYAGYCPVSVQRQQAGEALYVQPGSSKHSALYQSRLYRFSSPAALQLFLAYPTRYSGLTVPSPLPLPLHLQPLPLAADVVHSFLTLNFNARLAGCLSTLSKQRHTLLYPGLSVQQTALIHLALQLRGDAVRLQAFEGECQLGRDIAKEAESGAGSEEMEVRHAAYDAIQAEVAGKEWRTVQRYVEDRFFPVV